MRLLPQLSLPAAIVLLGQKNPGPKVGPLRDRSLRSAAAGVFLPFGALFSPALRAASISASTVIVVINGQLLHRIGLAS